MTTWQRIKRLIMMRLRPDSTGDRGADMVTERDRREAQGRDPDDPNGGRSLSGGNF